MTEKRTITESALQYDPVMQALSVRLADIRLVHHDGVLQLDRNPHGEESLTPVTDMQREEGVLRFTADRRTFELTGSSYVETLLFDQIGQGLGTSEAPSEILDKIELFFQQGALSTCYLYKNKLEADEYKLLDSLRIVREEEGLFLIKQKPFRKMKLRRLGCEDRTLVCETESGERHTFLLQVNGAVVGLVTGLLTQANVA